MLLKKMLRDMKIHNIQFISIFLMSLLALTIYSGLGSESRGYEVELEQYYKDTNFADIWLYSLNFTKEDETLVRKLEEITEVNRRLMVEVSAVLDGNPVLTLYFQNEDRINQLYIKEGEAFDAEDTEGIWLDYEFAQKRNLTVGNTIKLSYQGMILEKTIKGLVYSPEYVYMESSQMIPDHSMKGFAFLSYQALPTEMSRIFNEMVLTIEKDSKEQITELEEKLYQLLPQNSETGSGGLSIFLEQKNQVSNKVFRNEISERKAMTTVFPIVFLAIVLLIIATTMSRLVKNQRTQIGVLKALGFQKGRITRHYMFYSLVLTLSGSILGAVLGPAILPALFYEAMRSTYTLPVWKPSFLPSTILILSICVLLSTYITYLACRKILRETPSEVLRPKAPKTSKLSSFEKTNFWKRRGFLVQWNVRDILRSKTRSFMAVVGVAGCMGLLITGFGCLNAFESMTAIKYGKICNYSNKYKLEEDITKEEIDAVEASVNGQLLMEKTIELKSASGKESSGLSVHDEITYYQYLGEAWEKINLPKQGISLSKKLAEKLEVAVSDTIKWHIYGDSRWVESEVTAIYRDPAEQGAVVSKSEFESAGFQFLPNSILSLGEKIDQLPGVATVENVEQSKASINSMLEPMYLLIGILCLVAALLEIVVLYNLGVLSFAEKERELATLKVIGFQSGRIRKLLLLQNIWLTVIGLVPGYFFGILTLKTIMSFMGAEFDLPLRISPGAVVLCMLFTLLLSIAVNYFFSGKVRKLDMVSSLKGVE